MNEENVKKEIEEVKEKLRNLFYEMLEYKNKKFDKNLSFEDLMELTSIHYNNFKFEFQYAYSASKYGSEYVSVSDMDNPYFDHDKDLSLSDERILETLEELYQALTEEGNDYKVHANDFIDINLEDGKTLKEIFDEYLKKLEDLFKEMLEFQNIEYDKNSSFYSLWLKVAWEYPLYYNIIDNLHYNVGVSLDANYIDEINACNRVYNRLLNYKEEYSEYYEKNKECIEAHKKWLIEKDEIEEYNKKISSAKEKDPLSRKCEELEKEARKNSIDEKLCAKNFKEIKEIEKELDKKYIKKKIPKDPYYKLLFGEDDYFLE